MFRRLPPTEMSFEASATSKRKDNSPQASLPCGLPLPPASKPQFPTNGFRNVGPNSLSPITREYCQGGTSAALQVFPRRFSSGVRTDLPMSKYCSHGNLLRFSLLCSRQNNRYYNQDLHWVHDPRGLAPHASARAPRSSYAALVSTTRPAGVP